MQTGFRLQGTSGIITALHGVADARDITAVNEKGDVYSKLRLIKVDIQKDAAILYSDKMSNASIAGLISHSTGQISSYENLKVLGHPQGIGLTTKSVTSGSPVLRQLKTLIPPASSLLFLSRNSPSPSIDVIYIEGSLVSGNSGSPIFNKNNHVIGIVNGGILGGAAGISWAIPIADIRFSNISDGESELRRLKSSATDQLFAYEYLPTYVSSKNKQYAVNYFEITDLRPVTISYLFSDLEAIHKIATPIKAPNRNSLKLQAGNEVISYLKTDSGSYVIAEQMNKYRRLNTQGQMLTFASGASINELRQLPYDDAIEKYSIGLKYDSTLCKILNVDIDYRYSDYLNAYTGNIRNVKLELSFTTAICSQIKQGLFSEEELESLKSDWTKFIVVKMEQK
jgi:hypothetical protein